MKRVNGNPAAERLLLGEEDVGKLFKASKDATYSISLRVEGSSAISISSEEIEKLRGYVDGL